MMNNDDFIEFIHSFDDEFSRFVDRGGYPFFMGYGGTGAYSNNSNMAGSFSWKCLVYDYGLIGLGYIIIFYILLCKSEKIKKEHFPFLAVYIASIYQRPYVMDYMYLSLFICALGSISAEADKINKDRLSDYNAL